MAINTDSISSEGTTTAYDWTGGDGVAIATGVFAGELRLEYSLDDTNYAPVGKGGALQQDGGFGFKLPACKVRWRLTKTSDATSAITASVENV